MPTRPGAFVANDVLTAADMNLLPGGVIGVGTRTTDQTVAGGSTDLTGLSVTFTAPGGRRYRVSVTLPNVTYTTDPIDENYLILKNGADDTLAGVGFDRWPASVPTSIGGVVLVAVVSPPAGSVTLKAATNGSGNKTMVNSSIMPSVIIVEDIGPA
jgi:hypothetical protein